MKKLELYLGIGMGFFLLMGFVPFPIPFAPSLMSSLGLILAAIYIFLGGIIFNDIGLQQIFKKTSYQHLGVLRVFGAVVAGISLGRALISLVFGQQMIAGAEAMLGASVIELAVILLVVGIKFVRGRALFYRQMLVRTVIIMSACVVFFLLPEGYWIDVKYQHHPEYGEILKKLNKDPHNPELLRALEIEKAKARKRIMEQ